MKAITYGRAACAMAWLLLSAAPLAAQDSTAVGGAWVIGGSVGLPGQGWDTEPELFTAAVHATFVEALRPGGELFLGTMPRFLAEGDIAFGARGGLAVPIPVSAGILLVPSAGVGFIARRLQGPRKEGQ